MPMAGGGGATRATGWRATAIRFQQFGEGARSMSSSLSRFSGWRSRSLSLGEGLADLTGRSGWHPRFSRCRPIEGGAGFFL